MTDCDRYRDALMWIATRPIHGPSVSWWDMRAKAREALGLPDTVIADGDAPNYPKVCEACDE